MFKSKFENLSSLQKIELYLIVIMFFGSIVYFSDQLLKDFIPKEKKESIYQTRLDTITQKISPQSNQEILNYLEKYTSQKGILVDSLDIDKHNITVEIKGTFIALINLISLIDNHLKIIKFTIEKYGTSLRIILTLDTQYFYNANYIFTKNEKPIDPFVKIRAIKAYNHHKSKVKSINITAIVGKEVLIDGRWYRIGDIISSSKIIKINSPYVTVKDMTTNTLKQLGIINE